MAKKKTGKAKKSSGKKKASKKAKKSTKKSKKNTKKTKKGSKKTTDTASSAQLISISYGCVSGLCLPNPPGDVHMSLGDTVDLIAVNRDVDVKFAAGSPFQSGPSTIHIANGQKSSQVVGYMGTFKYTYSCKNPRCPNPANNPRMIVP